MGPPNLYNTDTSMQTVIDDEARLSLAPSWKSKYEHPTKLVLPSDPILHEPLPETDFDTYPSDYWKDLTGHMAQIMHEQRGIGLAANQIGLDHRAFVFYCPDTTHHKTVNGGVMCINPKIVWQSDDEVLLEEGCLSYPGLLVKIKRPRSVRIRFKNWFGRVMTKKFTGITARVIQHEMDHLDGIVHLDLASRLQRDIAFRKMKKKNKQKAR